MSTSLHDSDSTIEHFRHQARQLHSAVQARTAAAADLIVRHLSRLSGASADDVFSADVGLQECQHVIARDAGYTGWSQLVALGTPGFEDITKLSDADIRVLLSEVGSQDMAIALLGLTEGPMSKKHHAAFGLLRQVPQAVRDELRQQAGRIKADAAVIADTQRRIALQARMLEEQGLIGKPSSTSPEARRVQLPDGLNVWQRSPEALSPEQIRTGLKALALAHQAGILETTIPVQASGYVWQGVRLTVDGTGTALLRDILETQAWTALRHVDLRWRRAIEATVSIAHGDNPRFMPLKLAAIYSTDPNPPYREVEGTVQLALDRLQTPATSMSLDEITELYTDLAWIARVSSAVREDGLAVFADVADAMDDELMAMGLRRLAEQVVRQRPVDDSLRAVINSIMDEMEVAVAPRLAQVKLRYMLVCEGIVAIAEGCSEEELGTILDDVRVEDEVRIYRR